MNVALGATDLVIVGPPPATDLVNVGCSQATALVTASRGWRTQLTELGEDDRLSQIRPL